MKIRPYEGSDESAVVFLWERCDLLRPWNDPRRDIQRKLRVEPRLFLVGLLDEVVVATVMAGYEGHRGWINYLAVALEHRRRGFGCAMMAEAERLLQLAGCPKVNLQIRGSNSSAVEFYRRLGYRVDDVISLGKRLERDE